MKTFKQEVAELTEQFIHTLVQLAQTRLIEAAQNGAVGALTNSSIFLEGRRRRRRADTIAQMELTLAREISRSPGITAEKLNARLNFKRDDTARPLAKLVAARLVKTRGLRRKMEYTLTSLGSKRLASGQLSHARPRQVVAEEAGG